MSSATAVVRSDAAASKDETDPAALRRTVERTRAELAETVEGLVYQLDVPARAKEKVADAKSRLRTQAEELRATAQTRARDLTAKAKTEAEALRVRALSTWQDQPGVVVAAGAVATGVVVGIVVLSARKGSK